MKNKIILMCIESIFFTVLLYLMVVNQLANTTSQFCISLDGNYVVLNTFFVILMIFVLGVFCGFVYSFILGARYRDQIEFYARKTEKLSQQNEIDSDDKEALQRKIASLEIALDNALKNKD